MGGKGFQDVHIHATLRLHEFDREPEKPARFIPHHLEIVRLARTCQAVAPVQIHALAPMQVQQLLGEDLDELGVVHAQQVL